MGVVQRRGTWQIFVIPIPSHSYRSSSHLAASGVASL
jgi:hypothetical protein